MNKEQLIQAINENTGVSLKNVESVLNGFCQVVTNELAKGGEVKLVGWGTFTTTERAERVGTNPQTGEPMTIAAARVPKFKAGTVLKDKVNKGKE